MIDFKEELEKLTEEQIDPAFVTRREDVGTIFQTINGIVTKLFKKQGAMSMQVEEMYSILEESENNGKIRDLEQEHNNLVQVLITAADLIEDFYLYYKENYEEAMAVQSELMWHTICKTMAGIGLIRISDEGTPFNAKLNHVEGVIEDPRYENGFIMNVLKSGYQYKNQVYRKSSVIVNKWEDTKDE